MAIDRRHEIATAASGLAMTSKGAAVHECVRDAPQGYFLALRAQGTARYGVRIVGVPSHHALRGVEFDGAYRRARRASPLRICANCFCTRADRVVRPYGVRMMRSRVRYAR